jgi:hypothetical protein
MSIKGGEVSGKVALLLGSAKIALTATWFAGQRVVSFEVRDEE